MLEPDALDDPNEPPEPDAVDCQGGKDCRLRAHHRTCFYCGRSVGHSGQAEVCLDCMHASVLIPGTIAFQSAVFEQRCKALLVDLWLALGKDGRRAFHLGKRIGRWIRRAFRR